MKTLSFIAAMAVGVNLVLWSSSIDMPLGKCYAPMKPDHKIVKQEKTNAKYLDIVVSQYDVSAMMVKDVIQLANKYQKKTFPKTEDILALIGIESSWNPNAKSPLKVDPAIGLTQIRPVAWKKLISHPSELLHIENQIKYASDILHYNFRLTKSKDDAIIAYNVGYGNWLDGNYDLSYFTKFVSERDKFRRG